MRGCCGKTRFIITRDPLWMGRGISVRIVVEDVAQRTAACVEPPTLRPMVEGETIPVAIQLNDEDAQQLCDALWESGVRPTNGAGSVGQLAATQAHLEDMRRIAFADLIDPQRPAEE